MALVTYPLNYIDCTAEDAELFHCSRSSGIYANDDFRYSVTGSDNTVVIDTGLAWIRNSKFTGKVAALKEAVSKDMGVADSTYPRIDVIAIQFDANANATDIVVKHGTAAMLPSIPEISRTEAVYELYLYAVRREAGATVITAGDITDLRLDSKYCGLMADSVTKIDLDAIYAQINAAIDKMNQATEAAKKTFDPYALLRKDLLWKNDSPEELFPAQAIETSRNPHEYESVIVICCEQKTIDSTMISSPEALHIVSSGLLPVLSEDFSSFGKKYAVHGDCLSGRLTREFEITETGLSFSGVKCISSSDGNITEIITDGYMIPLLVYGLCSPEMSS